MAHGVRPHVARGVCDRKMTFTTYDAAAGMLSKVPGAQRVVKGSCCGKYHITSMTKEDFEASIAAQGCTDAWERGMMDLSTEEFLKRWDADHEEQADQGREPRARQGDAGEAAQQRSGDARLAPSPAEVARRLQARRDPRR